MLVVTRRQGEKIVIGNDIEIIILDIKGEQVKIGLNAPKNVTIYRNEIYEEIIKNNKEAATTPSVDVIMQLKKIANKSSKK
ncbi:MAG: carbon storage regulator CsrA [Clostridia bacterium]|nr:carbon storage regulator CsrA [Clostridia bacterium]